MTHKMNAHPADDFRDSTLATPALGWLTALADAAQDAMLVKNLEGQYIYCNCAGALFLGRSVQQVIGENSSRCFEADDAAQLQAIDREVLAQQVSMQRELSLKLGGEVRICQVVKSLFRNDRGEIAGITEVFRDVTAQRQTEAILLGQNRILEQIANDVPLNSILNQINSLMESLFPDALCSILICDQERHILHYGVGASLPKEYLDALSEVPIAEGVGSCGTAAHRRQEVIVSDIQTDPLWKDYRQLAEKHHFRACWSLPILSSETDSIGRCVLGTFAIYYRKCKEPQRAELEVVRIGADLAGIALKKSQSAQSLTESEELFRTLIDQAADAFFLHDLSGRFVDVNRRACESLQYTREELLTMTVFDIERNPGLPISEEFWTSIQQDHPETLQGIHRRKDGTDFPVEVRLGAVAIHDQQMIFALVRDVSARVDAERRLRLKKFTIDHAVESIFWIGPTAEILYVNEAACRTLGYRPGELIGKSISAIDPYYPLKSWPEHWAEIKRRGSFRFESTQRTKTGRLVETEVSVNYLCYEGQEINCAVVRDISERKRIERDFRTSEERFSKLFYNSPFSIMVATYPEGVTLEANESHFKIFETTREAVVGKTTLERNIWIDPADRQIMLDALARDHRIRNGEFWFRSARGTPRLLLLSVEIIEIQGQRMTLAMSIDITERRMAEDELKKTSQLLQAVCEGVTDAIFAKDTQGKYLLFNPAAAKFVNKPVTEVIGQDDTAIFDPESARLVMQRDRHVMQTGLVDTAEESLAVEGHFRTYLSTKAPLRDIQDNVIGVIGISHDITDRKISEDSLKESVSRLQATLDSTADGILVVDLQGRMVDFNQQFLKLWHFPTELLSEGRKHDLVAMFNTNESMHRLLSQLKSPDEFINRVTEIYQAPETSSFDVLEFQDGRIYERYSQPQVIDNRPVGRVWSFRDVTQRKRTEEALITSQRTIQAVADALPLTVYVYDLVAQKVVYSNYRIFSVLGYLVDTIQKWNWPELRDIIHPDDQGLISEYLSRWENVEDAQYLESEYRLKHHDGSWHWFVGRDMVFKRAPDGRVQQIIGTAQDVTERKQLEQQVRESQKMEAVGQLAGGIAHDFNNLLTIINGYCDLLLAEQASSDPCRPSVLEIRDAGRRAAQLTQQLLAYSRKSVVKPVILDLNRLVTRSKILLQRLIGEQILLATQLDRQMLPIRVDSGHLDQVLMNLAVNARDAMPHGGHLTISTRLVTSDVIKTAFGVQVATGDYVELSVQDTGVGICTDILSQIFDPFFTTKEVGKGTGLGLAVVYGIVKQAGGFIHVVSAEKIGTTFLIWFPVTSPEESLPHEQLTTRENNVSGTILIIEDEPALRKMLRSMLDTRGFRVLEANGSTAALDLIEQQGYLLDLLIVDIVMPGMTGFQLADLARKNYPDLPILFMSGFTSREAEDKLARGWNDSFLQKPFSPEDLMGKIAELLQHRPAES